MRIKCLHHFAYRCRDAEETRHFYEDILGLPLKHIIRMDHVPSTGEFCPYVHVFFQMRDTRNSCLTLWISVCGASGRGSKEPHEAVIPAAPTSSMITTTVSCALRARVIDVAMLGHV